MPKQNRIIIGKISGVHGLHGNLKILSYAESESVFDKGKIVTAVSESGDEASYTIKRSAPYKKGLLINFKGVDSISEAEKLKGCDLYILRESLPDLDEGIYYWVDLIGMDVESTDGEVLGTLASIFSTGSNDVYVVKQENKELLIPALKTTIIDIDLEAGRMVVDLPEGLE